MANVRRFVKAQDTGVPVSKSRADLERMLARYGAIGFGYSVNQETRQTIVEFLVPNTLEKGAPRVPIRIPVDTFRVYDALYGKPAKGYRYQEEKLGRAERVAWRNLLLWVDAALAAAALNFQTITEAFYAHTLVSDERGRTVRLADYIAETGGVLAPGVRALLPSKSGDA